MKGSRKPKPRQPIDPLVDATIAERGKIYGDPMLSHQCIGLVFTALIQHHYGIVLHHAIPASLVARMMVGLKNQRASLVYHQDNYTDAEAYLRFAEQFQKREQGATGDTGTTIHGDV